MSDLLQCDFPKCVARSETRENWHRIEVFPKWLHFVFAIPIIGNLGSFVSAVVPDRHNRAAKHLCPEHSKQIFEDYNGSS